MWDTEAGSVIDVDWVGLAGLASAANTITLAGVPSSALGPEDFLFA